MTETYMYLWICAYHTIITFAVSFAPNTKKSHVRDKMQRIKDESIFLLPTLGKMEDLNAFNFLCYFLIL